MSKILTFIGAGNMARSLIVGLLQDKTELKIRVADPDQAQLENLVLSCPGITTFTDNNAACEGAQIIVLAVKPQILTSVCESLATLVQKTKPLVISVAAGVLEATISEALGCNKALGSNKALDSNKALGSQLPIVRCMPNTPALVQAGATGLYANNEVSEKQHNEAEAILRSVGITLWFDDEQQLNAVTAVSGSGPAYFFLVMEAMQKSALQLGLNNDEARLLVLQTAMGAAKLALESSDDAGTLRERVTSKGGTTEAALNVLQEGGLPELFHQALTAAEQRSIELAKS